MEIVVCIKQVPGITEVQINPQTGTLMREGIEAIINPFDLYALEEGLRLKEKYGGRVTVLSMGPPQVEEAIREALSYGADEGVRVTDRAFAGSDTLATAGTLAAAIRTLGTVDIILMGRQAIDGDTGQVGPETAEHLGIPHVTEIKKIETIEGKVITLQRMLEHGYLRLRAPLPILLTVVKEINVPRPASFKGKLKARQMEIRTLTAEDLHLSASLMGLSGSPTRVVKIFTPPKPKGGKVFEGSPKETVAALLQALKEQGILLRSKQGG
ncbi:MAG: electron transfer flavoprotein subunit beta/FixA family protein [Spirochaetales bacterium]